MSRSVLDQAATLTMHRAPQDRPLNHILARLPFEDLSRMQPDLHTVQIAHKQIVVKQGETVEHVYFPNSGVFSMTTAMADGSAVEVATIGKEGLVGLQLFFEDTTSAGEVMLQVPEGSAERMSVGAFRKELDRHGALQRAIRRYAQALMTLMGQSIACMALHHADARCCRWLLMTHDRVERDQFMLSQEFLAMMLGVSRPTASTVAGVLQDAGFIRYSRGRMTILNRQALEQGACECYRTVKTEFERLGG